MERIDEMQEHNGSLKCYWKPRAYQRLDSGGRPAGRSKMKFGGGWRQRLRRIKVAPKLKILQETWPKRLFACIHRAYVRTMLAFAHKLRFGYDGNEFGGFRGPPRKKDEERLILHLQKLLFERNRRYAVPGITSGEID